MHHVGTAARVATLLFAAELALDIVPGGSNRDTGRAALSLASRVASGEAVDPKTIVQAIQNEDDEGPLINEQAAPPGPQAHAWVAVASALGYAAWQEYARRGMHPNSLVENFDSPDAIDFCIDSFVGIPDMDWQALRRATAWIRRHASKADQGWGQPVNIGDLRRAATGDASAAG